MIQTQIVMDSGAEIYLGTDYGSYYDVDPLTAVDATVNTLTGYQQTGVILSGTSIGGIDRTVSGTFVSADARTAAHDLCMALVPGASGKLYMDNVYIEFVVEKSPELTYLSHNLIDFEFMLFSANPYWKSTTTSVDETCVWVPQFKFPASYTSHIYATRTDGFASLQNNGNVESTFTLTFTALRNCANVYIQNVDTLEKLTLECALEADDTVVVSWQDGSLSIVKNGTTNLFSALTDDSDLFYLHTGGNLIKSGCDEGEGYVSARIEFSETYTAYVPED